MKICTRCGETKQLTEYYKTGKYYRSECKCCSIELCVNYFRKNKKKRFCIDCGKEITNYKRCDDCIKKKKNKEISEYYIKNKNKISEYKKQWYINKLNKNV